MLIILLSSPTTAVWVFWGICRDAFSRKYMYDSHFTFSKVITYEGLKKQTEIMTYIFWPPLLYYNIIGRAQIIYRSRLCGDNIIYNMIQTLCTRYKLYTRSKATLCLDDNSNTLTFFIDLFFFFSFFKCVTKWFNLCN